MSSDQQTIKSFVNWQKSASRKNSRLTKQTLWTGISVLITAGERERAGEPERYAGDWLRDGSDATTTTALVFNLASRHSRETAIFPGQPPDNIVFEKSVPVPTDWLGSLKCPTPTCPVAPRILQKSCREVTISGLPDRPSRYPLFGSLYLIVSTTLWDRTKFTYYIDGDFRRDQQHNPRL